MEQTGSQVHGSEWVKEEPCQLCPALTQVFHVSLCHRYSHMGQSVLVAFPDQAAPGLTANHSTEKARIITSFGALLPLARCPHFSCIFQLIPMTTVPWTSEAGKWHRVQEWRKLWLSFQPWICQKPPKALNKRQSIKRMCPASSIEDLLLWHYHSPLHFPLLRS